MQNIISAFKKMLVFTTLCGFQALAATSICNGTVKMLSYHADNSFMIQLSGMNDAVLFCDPQQVWRVTGTPYTTGPETCKMMYSTFLAAKMAGKTITNMYLDGDNANGSCNNFVAWARVNIRHYQLN
jgi:hypothetical protein